jgi:hypothetical protein
MTRTYVQVIVLETAIIIGLWAFGRIFEGSRVLGF